MIMDLFIVGPVIVFTLLGMRDGLVRKLVATLTIILALVLGHFYMRDVGQFLVNTSHINPNSAPEMGYYAILFFLFFVQAIIYRFGAGNYKLGGVVDRVGGTIMGLIEGIVMMSVMLYISLMSGPYPRDWTRDSQFFEATVNLSPQILDFTTNVGPETFEKLQDLTTPKGNQPKKPAPKPSVPGGR
jgi:uncharacterized membrane protein required for colicin V production